MIDGRPERDVLELLATGLGKSGSGDGDVFVQAKDVALGVVEPGRLLGPEHADVLDPCWLGGSTRTVLDREAFRL